MTQFFKTYKKLYKNGCKPNQAAILTAIFDRMESSRKRTNFYSDTYNDYFVIYTYEELASELNLSKNTVANIIKKCVEQGYLMIELMHNRVNKIFMTTKSKELAGIEDLDNNQGTQNCDLDTKNCDLIKLNKHTNKTNITNITENLVETIINQLGLSEKLVNSLLFLTKNDPKQIYHIISLLIKAKARAGKLLNKQLKFEDSIELLEKNLYGIVFHSQKKEHQDAYIFASFVKMFTNKPKLKHNPRVEVVPEWLSKHHIVKANNDDFEALKVANEQLLHELGLGV